MIEVEMMMVTVAMTKIRLFLVESGPLNGLLTSLALQQETDLELVGLASTVDDGALAQIQSCQAVVINHEVLTEETLALVRAVAGRAPGVRILVTGAPHSEESHQTLLEAGASGLLPAGAPLEELLRLIRRPPAPLQPPPSSLAPG